MKPDETKRRSIVVCGKGGGSSTVTWDDIQDKPDFAEVATSGDYEDLSNTPSLATVATSGSYNDLSNTPSLATVATSGSYNDLSNTPSLATVATTGNYEDLSNTPTLATVATTGDYEDLSNKPTIPVIPPMTTETITFLMEGGVTRTVDFYVVPNYFYVQDTSGSDNTLTIKATDYGLPTITVYKSTDQKNWTSMGNITTSGITATVPANGRLYLKANAGTLSGGYGNTTINCANNFNVGGYAMSLVNGDNLISEFSGNGNIKGLFTNSTTLINASDLVLSATTLTNNCYTNMFSSCTSLTTAPALPATTLADYCYESMFQGCTSLTTAPVLPATTLTNRCYNQMFSGCTNINKIVCYANGTRDVWQTGNWLYGVAATGDFYKLGNYNFNTGASGIPTGWTEHTSL